MSAGATPNEIDLDQAAAGMTLAGALLDAHGGVLLPQDTALTDSMLASLRRRGVQRCVVWCAAPAEAVDPAHLARERERRLLRLARLFRHQGGEPGTEPGTESGNGPGTDCGTAPGTRPGTDGGPKTGTAADTHSGTDAGPDNDPAAGAAQLLRVLHAYRERDPA